ncbi:50S ribosomal protein L10 [Putridiphycobacter roseus]|uniref:Large ribosomal subunit protein uL10 n=1 Tax=Putridiphycobacter roseus TaxID=2219161 RepID=A0A2W1MXP9_9FLAO|nr:50S ribosomal protein L10 [Putridiphycobacter roseus]PZE16929.1 50S ribosomal protein L10 [Putridiphycobacter roseus]
MTKDEKSKYIEDLSAKLSDSGIFYLADTAELTVEKVNDLRRKCFNNNIELKVVKNTLLQKALERIEDKDFSELYGVLAGPTSIMFAEVGNAPAKMIKDFRKKNDKPILKAAYIDESIYVGDDNLDLLASIKSKEELIGDIVGLLQSPAKNVISGLKSGGSKLAGILKTLEARG